MSSFDTGNIYQSAEFQQELAIQRTFMSRVYGWMTLGLLVTAFVALAITSSKTLISMFILNRPMQIGLIIAEFAAAMAFMFLVQRVPVAVAGALFLLYSALTGATFAVILLIYTFSSVAATFFITAGMFGTMSFIGYTTKKDLSGVGSFMMMGLIGIIIASIVNIFLWSPMLSWVISFVGVIVFTGLTAYDTQKIRQSYANAQQGSAAYQKTALYGAFVLYLDFINLFLFLMRLLGSRRD
jgi:FtsH-binding integral membrane protein